jgi:hypothetical protein
MELQEPLLLAEGEASMDWEDLLQLEEMVDQIIVDRQQVGMAAVVEEQVL